jgi:hypothetical protein
VKETYRTGRQSCRNEHNRELLVNPFCRSEFLNIHLLGEETRSSSSIITLIMPPDIEDIPMVCRFTRVASRTDGINAHAIK